MGYKWLRLLASCLGWSQGRCTQTESRVRSWSFRLMSSIKQSSAERPLYSVPMGSTQNVGSSVIGALSPAEYDSSPMLRWTGLSRDEVRKEAGRLQFESWIFLVQLVFNELLYLFISELVIKAIVKVWSTAPASPIQLQDRLSFSSRLHLEGKPGLR